MVDAGGTGALVRRSLPQHVSRTLPVRRSPEHHAESRHPSARPLSEVIASDLPMLVGRPLISLSLAVNYAVGATIRWVGISSSDRPFPQCAPGVRSRPAHIKEHAVRRGDPSRTLWVAYAVAVLWMLHPLVTESVTYVFQRTELLMALFLLLTLYCFIRGIESPHKVVWFGAAIMACTLGMGTKEVMVVTPLLVFSYDSIFVARSWRTALRERRELYAGLVASWVVLVSLLLTTNLKSKSGLTVDTLSPWNYFEMQWTVVAHYLRLAVWPQGLVLDIQIGPVKPRRQTRCRPRDYWRRFSPVLCGHPPPLVVGILGRVVLPAAGAVIQFFAVANGTRHREENVSARCWR